MHPNCFKVPEARPGEVIYVTKGHFLAWGGTAIVERLPSGEVIKTPIPSPVEEEGHRRNMRVEAKIYEKIFDKFGEHPCIPRVIKWEPESCCLTMEYLENGNLDKYIRNHNSRIQSEVRHRWAKQAAEGLRILQRN
jgi:serine/threonine protein kinase